MKILLINWQDPQNPRAGGAEVHLHEIFRRLVSRGHPVTWLASGWPGCASSTSIDGIAIHRTASRYTFGLAAPAFLRHHLSSGEFDVIVEALNKVPVYTPLWTRKPVVLIVHHLFGTTAFREASLPLAAATWLQEQPIGLVYRRTQVHAISESTANDLEERGLPRSSIEIIYPGVDLSFFTPGETPTRAAEPIFIYLGRLQKYKRVDTILRAFASALPKIPSARLLIAGKGDQESRLRKLAGALGVAAAVDFLGYVSEEEKRTLFRRSWANVLMSPKEGWGITNLEAGACGTPTLASDSPGLRESVVDGETGVLVRQADHVALAAAMEELGSNPPSVERLGSAAATFARQFTWDRTAEEAEAHLLKDLTTR